jgi:mono/diheme cytochrome c family protein
MKKTVFKYVLLLGVLSLFASAHATTSGKQDYLAYCSSCHGIDGKGKGPLYLTTTKKPKDLTVLSQANGGNFPYVQIRKMIDGRIEKGNSRAHFKDGMPVWGDVFASTKGRSVEGQMHGEAVAKMRILNIVDYLVAIQEQCVGDCL